MPPTQPRAKTPHEGWMGNPNPPAAAEADQASSEGGGHEPPAGDGATRRPGADSKSQIRNQSATATASISICTPSGSATTCTAERAGGSEGKNSA